MEIEWLYKMNIILSASGSDTLPTITRFSANVEGMGLILTS